MIVIKLRNLYIIKYVGRKYASSSNMCLVGFLKTVIAHISDWSVECL